jgi:putative transposase
MRAGVRISMDARGRSVDNILVEPLRRSVKYEEVYLHEYENGWDGRGPAGALFDRC